MLRLHVNIDHVATLRNTRGTVYPDPVLAASLCELAGADGITAHLREDLVGRGVLLGAQHVAGDGHPLGGGLDAVAGKEAREVRRHP